MSEVMELSTEDLHDQFIRRSRLFLNDPTTHGMNLMLSGFASFYVAFIGSAKGLQEELDRMEANARNVMAARP